MPAATDGAQDPGQFWKDFIRDTSPEFRKPTIEQLATFMQPTWQALIDGARYCEPQLREIIDRQRPDVIVEDNVVGFPALVTAGAAVRPDRVVQSARGSRGRTSRRPTRACRPTIDPNGTPSGRSTTGPTGRRGRRSTRGSASRARPGCPFLEFIHTSDVLNLYVYPEVVDYTDRRPLDATWQRLDSSVRGDRRRRRAAGTDHGAPGGQRAHLPVARIARAAPTSA